MTLPVFRAAAETQDNASDTSLLECRLAAEFERHCGAPDLSRYRRGCRVNQATTSGTAPQPETRCLRILYLQNAPAGSQKARCKMLSRSPCWTAWAEVFPSGCRYAGYEPSLLWEAGITDSISSDGGTNQERQDPQGICTPGLLCIL